MALRAACKALGGLNTNSALDYDGYFEGKMKQIAFAEWQDPIRLPCHNPMPTAVLSMGLVILAPLLVSSGLVLDTVTRGRREMKMLAYLSQPALKRN